jgi:hypothetical protein
MAVKASMTAFPSDGVVVAPQSGGRIWGSNNKGPV